MTESPNPSLRRVDVAFGAYRAMVEMISEGAVAMSRDGVILDCNGRFADTLKRDVAQVIGSRMRDFIPAADVARIETLIRKAGARTARRNVDLLASDKTSVPASVAIRGLAHDGHEGVIAVVTNLGEARRREDLYRALVDDLNDGILVVDAVLTINFVNAQFARMLGVEPSDLLGRCSLEFMEGDAKSFITDKVARRRTGLSERYELNWRHRDGHAVPTLLSVRPIFDARRRFGGSISVVTDMSEQRRIEQSAHAAALYAHTRSEASLDPLVTIGPRGRITDVNEAAVRATGVSREELIGSDLANYFFDPERVWAGNREAFEKGSVKDYPLSLRHASGTVMEVLYNASAYRNEKGDVAGVVTALHDITDRKRHEESREHARRDVLTGLYNRRHLDETFSRELHRARINGTPLSVVMLDIDHFKNFNDTFGHDAGDLVLREVGDLLGKVVRPSDMACRYGGEEFLLVMPGADRDVTVSRVNQMARSIRSLKLSLHDQALPKLTVSAGIALQPEHGTTTKTLITSADRALYAAKHAGRDCVRVFDAGSQGAARIVSHDPQPQTEIHR